MKRLGPELKMPDLGKVKVPSVVTDLYYDLRDRRLLPLVALILVAIVAAPLLLGGSAEEPDPAPSPRIGGTLEGAEPTRLTVAEAQPGLRDFRKRLSGHTPTDPFEQRFTGPPGNGGLPDPETTASTSPSPSSDTGSSTSVGSPPESAPPADSGSGGEGGSEGSEPGELRLFTFAAKIRIIHTRTKANGKKEGSEPEIREEVIPPTALPSPKAQVVTFMGISPKTRKPLFLVSDDVEAIFGEGNCLSGSQECQLLEVDLGLPTTFVYAPTGARYKINVLEVEPVFRGRYED
jgi:hypothetical protein